MKELYCINTMMVYQLYEQVTFFLSDFDLNENNISLICSVKPKLYKLFFLK
jgi:hypothetical protein